MRSGEDGFVITIRQIPVQVNAFRFLVLFSDSLTGFFDGMTDYVATYIDDFAVFSQTWEEHLVHLTEVFQRLNAAVLTLNAEKCTIGANSCSFLGHEVGRGCIKPLSENICSKNFRPKTKHDVCTFLGLTGYYRKFIPHNATRTIHLTDSLGGKQPENILWTSQMVK